MLQIYTTFLAPNGLGYPQFLIPSTARLCEQEHRTDSHCGEADGPSLQAEAHWQMHYKVR